MTDRPLYRSVRESFSRDIYMPMCGVVAAPVVIFELKEMKELTFLQSDMPPQIAILHLTETLDVTDKEGKAICTLSEALQKCSRSVPVLYFDSVQAADALSEFTFENNLADAILCAPFQKKEILGYAYAKMPLLRGMLDARGENLSEEGLPGLLTKYGATSLIVSAQNASARFVSYLQKRFIHVVSTDESVFHEAAARGMNGVITDKLAEAYNFLSRFPENAFLRVHKLYAHKGFSNDGQYPENSITSVTAAGKHCFDGAEIDIKLTSDDVPVVMHNTDTRGLFDCDVLITEKTDYKTLSSLRRIGFPSESIDRFEDLMHAMKEYEDTPVLIEFKPGAKYNNLEEMIRMVAPILESDDSQKDPIAIMGTLNPGHAFLHRKLPALPLGFCEGSGSMPDAPRNREEAEECIYRMARVTAGCAAGYNAEDVKMNRLLNEYAKFRLINVFPWSRSWTLEPSLWEKNGPENVRTYLSGYDAWTTDHGEKFLSLPVAVEPCGTDKIAEMSIFRPRCRLLFRDGHREEADADILVISGNAKKLEDGTYEISKDATVMFEKKVDLYFGESCTIYSLPVKL